MVFDDAVNASVVAEIGSSSSFRVAERCDATPDGRTNAAAVPSRSPTSSSTRSRLFTSW